MVEKTMDKIVALAKTRGFVYPGSEIYGEMCIRDRNTSLLYKTIFSLEIACN